MVRRKTQSLVCYAAYAYFEKARLVLEKHRSRHREAMEVLWEENRGHDRTTDEKR